MTEGINGDMSNVNLLVSSKDHERRIVDLEADMKAIKPIVYDTANAVKQIEKSVVRMTENSDKIRGYFLAALISGAVGIGYFAVKALMGVG